MARSRDVVLIEPYYGGSHAAFVAVLERFSRHRIRRVALPARKWKWRMRGAAIWVTRDGGDWLSGADGGGAEALLCSDMLSVSDLRALLPAGRRDIPIIAYFHENQLTYPIPDEEDRDYQYGMTNITSCLAADAVWFNSRFHLEDFLGAASRLLRKMPDYVPDGVIEEIRARSAVHPPPVAVDAVTGPRRAAGSPPRILWCHRWEYDKNPEPFFEALIRLDEVGALFEIVLLGEQFRTAPPVFADAWPRLQGHLVHAGFVAERRDYLSLLASCDVVVSTAIQENFGIAVAEAVLAGCQPLLPDRLAYPELIPEAFHATCLYPDDKALFDRLLALVDGSGRLPAGELAKLRRITGERFSAPVAVTRIDDAIESVLESAGSAGSAAPGGLG